MFESYYVHWNVKYFNNIGMYFKKNINLLKHNFLCF